MEDGQVKVGTRVRICRDPDFGPGPWPDEPIGTVMISPQGNASETVETASGDRRMFWIVFDEPQFDVEGDGPYTSAQVLDKYLEVLID